MEYRNKFYRMLVQMGNYCKHHNCSNCPFKMEDICSIEDLFYDFTIYSPCDYVDVYIKWFNKWEAKYNELYS